MSKPREKGSGNISGVSLYMLQKGIIMGCCGYTISPFILRKGAFWREEHAKKMKDTLDLECDLTKTWK